MGVNCSCDGDYEWFYSVEDGERISCATGKCYGCSGDIKIGDEVRRMWQQNSAFYDGYGGLDEGIETVLGRLCPKCSGLYDSLIELGFSRVLPSAQNS